MGKTKNRSRSEIEYLRGKIRKLESQLKWYKQRAHFFEAPVEDIVSEVEEVTADQCPVCREGVITIYDFHFATLAKCSDCTYEKRQKKK